MVDSPDHGWASMNSFISILKKFYFLGLSGSLPDWCEICARGYIELLWPFLIDSLSHLGTAIHNTYVGQIRLIVPCFVLKIIKAIVSVNILGMIRCLDA